MSTIAENPIEKTPRRNVSERATVRVTEELDSLVQQLRRQLWLRGIFLSTGTGLVVLLTLIVVDAIVQPQSVIARFFLWLAGFLLCAETIRRSLWKPLREHCSRLNLAWSLEQRHPQIEERLTSTLQLAARDEARSSAFVEAIATQAQSGMADCSEESLAGRSLRNAIIIATICITAFVLGLLLAPERLIPSLANVLRPWHDRVLPRLTAQVLPGNAEIAEGADLEIQVTGLDDSSAVLELLADAATSERDRVRESHSMVTDPEKRGAAFLLQDVEESLTYRVRSRGLYSDIFRIIVHPAPVITGLQATMTFPDYTQLPPATVDLLTPRNPSDAASVPMMMTLPGARVTVTGTANMPISEAAMLRDSNALTGKPAVAEGSQHSWEFEINSLPADAQSLVQHCSVTMTSDHQVPSEPALFEIHVARDLPPAVEIQGLNADTLTVRPDQSLEIPFSAVDDFGIQKLELAVRKSAQEPSLAIIPATQPGEPDADVPMRHRNGSTTLDIAALNVKPGEALSVWLKVGDNRIEPLGGTQSSDSRIITLQIAEDAAPVGQQAVQQQHENAQKELRTAIDHLKTAQFKVERLSQSLPNPRKAPDENPSPKALTPKTEEPVPAPEPAPARESSDPSENSPATPDSDAPTDPESADKAASEAREQIQSAQQALQRMQDRANEQPSPLFQPEMKQAQEVSEQELKKAEQQSSLIPLSDDLQQKQVAAEATAKELEQAIQKLEQIQSDLSQRSKDMELAAQLDELAKQQEKLAQRMKEDQPEAQNPTQPQKETPAKADQPLQDQPAASKDPSKDVQQKKQKDIADALQKLAASDEDARSELFQKRAEETSKLAEETQRLQEQQERLNQLKDSQDQPEQNRDEQLMEMIAKEQDSIAQQTRELDQAQKDRQAAKELEAAEEPNPDAAEVPQQPEKSLEEAGRQMDEASKQLRQKNVPQAEEQAQQAADSLKKSHPEDTSDEAAGQKPEALTPGNDSKADEKMESLTKQQERVRDAIQAVRENRPEDAASKLQEQIAERTEQVRQKSDELLQRPTDDEENREAMKAAQEKLQQAAEQTKAANEPQQPKDQQPQNQEPQNQQRSKAAKALDEATQALQNVCKSCQNCSQCNKPGSSAGSSGKSGNSSKQANASEGKEGAPREGGVPKEGGPPQDSGAPKDGGPPQDNGDKKQLAKAAEKATQTAKKPTPEGAKELSRDLNQLADQAAKKSQFPGRKPSDANSKQVDKDGKPGNDDSPKPGEQSSPKNAANGKPGGKSNQPNGATGNAQSSDQLDSPEQLRGPSTSNWTRSRRMLNGSVLDDRDAKVPQEYRGVVEDYFEQLSRIESADRNAAAPAGEGGAENN